MKVTILERDVDAGTAKLKFEHNDVVFTQSYNLKLVVPGTDRVLAQLGLEFTEDMQQTVIDRLTTTVTREIDEGIIRNPPE